jgi:hypothetical protein
MLVAPLVCLTKNGKSSWTQNFGMGQCMTWITCGEQILRALPATAVVEPQEVVIDP